MSAGVSMNTSAKIKRKVLLTVNNNRLSGIEKFTLLLARYIDKDKFKVTVGVPTSGPLCDLFNMSGIDYFIFENGKNEKHTVNGGLNIYKNIRMNKYDIVHAQAGITPCIAAKAAGVRFVIEHKHGLDFTDEEIKGMNFLKLQYEKTKKYFTDYTLTGCEKDRKVLIDKFGYDEKKVITVYNGLEAEETEFKKERGDKIIIGTIGRLTYQKGQEYFIEMAKILSEERKDCEFHIYGEGENYMMYRNLIVKYNLEDRVFLKGYTNNISETMKTFDVFVLSSRYEGIPYVILEAMRNSIPIVTTDAGGISEVIENMRNGIIVEKENPSELARSVNLLLNDGNLIKKLTQNSKNDFESGFRIEESIKRIESVYNLK